MLNVTAPTPQQLQAFKNEVGVLRYIFSTSPSNKWCCSGTATGVKYWYQWQLVTGTIGWYQKSGFKALIVLFLVLVLVLFLIPVVIHQENAPCQHPAVHGLHYQAPAGHCNPVVRGLQPLPPPAHHWDQVRDDQTYWHCTADCTGHGVSMTGCCELLYTQTSVRLWPPNSGVVEVLVVLIVIVGGQ